MRKRGWVVVTDTDDEEAEDAEGAQAGAAMPRPIEKHLLNQILFGEHQHSKAQGQLHTV